MLKKYSKKGCLEKWKKAVENLLKTNEKRAYFNLDKRKMYKKCKENEKPLSEEEKTKSFPQKRVENLRKKLGKKEKTGSRHSWQTFCGVL